MTEPPAMPDRDRPWYTITYGAGLQSQKHLYRGEELTSALRMYGYVRRDFPGGYRVDLRWAEEGLGPHGQPYDGQVWQDRQLLIHEGARSAGLLLVKLRASSATLELPVEW